MNSPKLGSISLGKVKIFSVLAQQWHRLTAIAKSDSHYLFYEICDCRFDQPKILLRNGIELSGHNVIIKQHVFYVISDGHLEMPHAFASGSWEYADPSCDYYQLLTVISNGTDASSYQGFPDIMAVKSDNFASLEGQFKSQAFDVHYSCNQRQLEIKYSLPNNNSTQGHLGPYQVSCQLAPNRPHNLSGYSSVLASVPQGQARHLLKEEGPLDKTYSENESYWQEQKSLNS